MITRIEKVQEVPPNQNERIKKSYTVHSESKNIVFFNLLTYL